MKKQIIFVALMAVCFCGVASAYTTPNKATMNNIEKAWKKVIWVETKSGTHPDAYKKRKQGDWGIAQITPILVKDVNRIQKKKYTHSDSLNDKLAKQMFIIYLTNYARNSSVEKMCRLWHRGPSKKYQYDQHGDRYWKSCQRAK